MVGSERLTSIALLSVLRVRSCSACLYLFAHTCVCVCVTYVWVLRSQKTVLDTLKLEL